jgi:hypothetical protein
MLRLLERVEHAFFEVLDPIRACDIKGTRRGIVAMLLDPDNLDDSADQRAIQRYCTKHRAAIRERLARAQKAPDKATEQSAMPSCRGRTQSVNNEVRPSLIGPWTTGSMLFGRNFTHLG